MVHPLRPPPLLDAGRRQALSADMVATIILKSAWRGLTRAFLIQLLTGVAISLLSGIVAQMTPSLPPGVSPRPQSSSAVHAVHHLGGKYVLANRFWILFAVLFVALCAGQFTRFLQRPKHRSLAARAILVSRRISRGWFRIFVGNAFIAWLSATLVVVLQHFSLTQLLWDAAFAVLQPSIQQVTAAVPGVGWLGGWYTWYAQNQAKLIFWLLYLAGVADDLGMPNYKTAAVWGRRRFTNRIRAALRLAPQRAS